VDPKLAFIAQQQQHVPRNPAAEALEKQNYKQALDQQNHKKMAHMWDEYVLVGPGRTVLFFCPNFLCLISQIQPIMLDLCPIMLTTFPQTHRENAEKCQKSSARTQKTAIISRKNPKSRENAQSSQYCAEIHDLPIMPINAGMFRRALRAGPPALPEGGGGESAGDGAEAPGAAAAAEGGSEQLAQQLVSGGG